MLILPALRRRALQARAHVLKPVVWIGSRGLLESVLQEVDQGLKNHELIKVRVSYDEREARNEVLEQICRELQAAPVQHIGKILVLYRPRPEKTEPGPAPGETRRSKRQQRSGPVSPRPDKGIKKKSK